MLSKSYKYAPYLCYKYIHASLLFLCFMNIIYCYSYDDIKWLWCLKLSKIQYIINYLKFHIAFLVENHDCVRYFDIKTVLQFI